MSAIYELLTNEATKWCAMAIVIFALTFAFKIPYKKLLTSHIKDEKKRKIANKGIVLFTLALGVALEFVWCSWQGITFTVMELGDGIKYALSAIALYSAIEIKTDGAIENPFNNEECQEIIDEVTEYVNKNKEKRKSKNKNQKEQTAEEKFLDLVGQNNEN